ncbi:hypothetical protein LSH36_75g10006 [Paralvinella palmiformis]|uniref:Non-structural maintenance of chromosomes element 4 n=1 Tax=Paralvinella palmiformis TaxID=53620 RepID=A0AAD9K2R8_9ANNE|nr:hypothetical protein LSH36_75g10006 [Paralvinella palmiformis]
MPPKQAKRIKMKSQPRNDPEKSSGDEQDGIAEMPDEQLTDSSDLFGPRQDPKERLEIRQTYTHIREQIQSCRDELVKPGCDELQRHLEKSEQNFKKVRETREAAIDSGIVALISQLAKQQVQALHTDFCVFEPAEFGEKLITLIGRGEINESQRERVRISKKGWIKLGEASQPFFKRSPALHCMFGTFERGPPKKRVQRQRTQDKKEEGSSSQVKGPTEPKQLSSIKHVNEKEEVTTLEVERMLKSLRHHYHKNSDKPLCFFKFVVHPENFGLTVENLFYASFLVRDGLASILLNDSKLPVIEPVNSPRSEMQNGKEEHHQVVMSLTQSEWKVSSLAFESFRVPPWSSSSVLNHRSLPPVFEFRRGHI